MTPPDELDEALRAKLRAAAESLPAREHSAAYRAQLTRALVAEAQAGRRRPRWLRPGALTGLAAAAAVLLTLWVAPDLRQPAQQAAQPTPACGLPTALSVQSDEAGNRVLALGRYGRIIAESSAALRVEESSPCVLTLALEHGFLAGDLAKLRPAELRVRTAHGTVIIRGTRFSVRADQELEVVLLSGRVDIEDGSTHVLEPQQVFRKQGGTRQRLAAQPAQAQHIARLLETTTTRAASAVPAAAPALAPVPAPPRAVTVATPARASELLARAESARRNGKLGEARALYAQASAGRDDDAEVALLRWSRLELDARAFARVAELLNAHDKRFAAGKLQAETAWLRVLMLRAQGAEAEARRAARELVARFPSHPQAEAAEALLRAP